MRYEYLADAKTPDWCAFDKASALTAVVELTNFHLDSATSISIDSALQEKSHWVGWQAANDSRLYSSISNKASQYRSLLQEYSVSYIVGLFSGFKAVVNRDELDNCLYDDHSGLFRKYPTISGLLFFDEQCGQYGFTYMPNPSALRKLDVPTGKF